MTKKQIELSMLEMLKKVRKDRLDYLPTQIKVGDSEWAHVTYALDDLELISRKGFEEAKVEEVVKKLIVQSKDKLIEIVREENAFTEDEKKGELLLKDIKERTARIQKEIDERHTIVRDHDLQALRSDIDALIKLLEKDIQITQALGIISRDLKLLMEKLEKIEE